MKTNIKRAVPVKTHEGAPARHVGNLAQLRRSVMACLLWEDSFYESGEDIAIRIATLVKKVKAPEVAALAIEARTQMNLRHVPLLLLRELACHPQLPDYPKLLSKTIATVCQRADEPAELLALYWKDGKSPVHKQVKRGLAWALRRFNEYELAKYNREGGVTLRDVLFVSHPKPKDEAQQKLWDKLVKKELATPDTWETQLSAGADKKETFERLIREEKLGYLALIRNLRNMEQVGCDETLVRNAILARKGAQRVLPFRYISAARHAPKFEPQLDGAMQAALAEMPRLAGRTIVLVDNSGSMATNISGKSEVSRMDAAAGLAIVLRGMCDDCRVFAFSDNCKEVPARHGMALRDAIYGSMVPAGTNFGAAVKYVSKFPHERIVVISDEQSHDRVPDPEGKGYVINVAAYQNGVGYGPWVHIDGFSEATVRYIVEREKEE